MVHGTLSNKAITLISFPMDWKDTVHYFFEFSSTLGGSVFAENGVAAPEKNLTNTGRKRRIPKKNETIPVSFGNMDVSVVGTMK